MSGVAHTIRVGAIAAAAGVYLAVVGLLQMFDQRAIVVGILTLGQAALILIGGGAGFSAGRGFNRRRSVVAILHGLLAGVTASSGPVLILVATSLVNLRSVFLSLSPQLNGLLSFGLGLLPGIAVLIAGGAILGAVGALVRLLPETLQRCLGVGFLATLVFGALEELIQIIMQFNPIVDVLRAQLYTWDGLTGQGALTIFAAGVGSTLLVALMRRQLPAQDVQLEATPSRRSKFVKLAMVVIVIALLPILAGSYIGQVLLLIGLYCLMGMGLNIEVGLAGLLDLGFVAFFAVGAYTTALLTADSPFALSAYTAIPNLSYWLAMPISVLAAVVVGLGFGIPVLKVRGDYLAVATLGLGEIVRVLVQSDLAAPFLGGSKGILQIPKPTLGNLALNSPVSLFFFTLGCTGVAAYSAFRLENSRIGRAWMAVRDDEDVAQALGINLVSVKLTAYGLGAAFAGVAGSIFAVMLTSVYPSSFQLQISVNVLVLIVVGGMGSVPGVVVGAAILVGLPELLREFGEYRYLLYGILLILMMRVRPEGIWPSGVRRRELRDAAGEATQVEVAANFPVGAE